MGTQLSVRKVQFLVFFLRGGVCGCLRFETGSYNVAPCVLEIHLPLPLLSVDSKRVQVTRTGTDSYMYTCLIGAHSVV